jgi:isopenicillin N synthase-like dioxygenase
MATLLAMDQADLASPAILPSDDEIPVIDVSGVLAGLPGAVEKAAAQLRHAYEDVGFWFLAGHDVPQALIDATFGEAERFHALPLDVKMALKANRHNVGYLPMRGSTTRHSNLNANNKPNLLQGFLMKRDLPADHPDVIAEKLYRGRNLWPENLPGFRETCVGYCDAIEGLALRMLPLYATALDLPPDWFAHAFTEPQYTLRLAYYPRQDVVEENEFGIAPHVDSTFMTVLAQNRVSGLSVRTRSGRWIDAPAIPGTFLINSGELLRRWTNERFIATPHRVINRSGRERYSIPFFFDATIDYKMTCLPTCTSAENPPRHEPISYMDYQMWFQRQNYDHIREAGGVKVQSD